MRDTAEWWVAYFAATVKHALAAKSPETARSHLRDALTEFRASEACSPYLNQLLGGGGRKQRPRKTLEPLPDGYDLRDDWKPCGNPECRAPLPKRSRKLYCDNMCKNMAGQYAEDEAEAKFRADHPDYDSLPF